MRRYSVQFCFLCTGCQAVVCLLIFLQAIATVTIFPLLFIEKKVPSFIWGCFMAIR